MSDNPGGMLAYGYAIGGSETGWYVAETAGGTDHMELDLPWLHGDPHAYQVIELMEERLLQIVVGFTDPDPLPDDKMMDLVNSLIPANVTRFSNGRELAFRKMQETPQWKAHQEWKARKNQAERSLGLEFVSVGSSEYSEYVLTACEYEEMPGPQVLPAECPAPQRRLTFPFEVTWTETKMIDPQELENMASQADWDARLAGAVAALGITPMAVSGLPWRADHTRTPIDRPGFILGATTSN